MAAHGLHQTRRRPLHLSRPNVGSVHGHVVVLHTSKSIDCPLPAAPAMRAGACSMLAPEAAAAGQPGSSRAAAAVSTAWTRSPGAAAVEAAARAPEGLPGKSSKDFVVWLASLCLTHPRHLPPYLQQGGMREHTKHTRLRCLARLLLPASAAGCCGAQLCAQEPCAWEGSATATTKTTLPASASCPPWTSCCAPTSPTCHPTGVSAMRGSADTGSGCNGLATMRSPMHASPLAVAIRRHCALAGVQQQ